MFSLRHNCGAREMSYKKSVSTTSHDAIHRIDSFWASLCRFVLTTTIFYPKNPQGYLNPADEKFLIYL